MSAAAAIDARSDPRASVFLAAVLHVAGSAFPVRIRDLSPEGARIDGKDLPREGDVVRMKRGPHSVVAGVAWSTADACGLRFSTPIPVQEWIGYGSGHSGQQRVDDMIARVRAGGPAPALPDAAGQAARLDLVGAAEQLEDLSRQLDRIAESFASIPAVVDHGLAGLQTLDIAGRKLADLAVTMRAGG